MMLADFESHQLLKTLYDHYDFQKNSIRLFRRGINQTFQGVLNDQRHVFIRVQNSNFRSYQWLMAELEFCDYLKQHQFSANTAVKNNSGEWITEMTDNARYHIVVFEAFQGDAIDIRNPRTYTESNLILFGETLARLHNLSQDYHPQDQRPNFKTLLDQVTIDTAPDDILDCKQQFYKKIAELKHTPQNYGLIHGDFKFDNMLLNKGELQVFDFDHCFYYFYVADLLLPLKIYFCLPGLGFYPADNDYIDFFLKNVIQGYRKQRSLEHEQLMQIPLLMQGSFLRAYFELAQIKKMDDYKNDELVNFIQHNLHNNRLLNYDFSKFR